MEYLRTLPYQRRISICLILAMACASTVTAQTFTPTADGFTMTAEQTETKIIEVILKIVLPFLWTIVSPWFSGLIVAGVRILPPGVQYGLTSLIGAGFGLMAGAIPDFPYTMESAAEVGGSTALAAQFWANRKPSVANPTFVTGKET